MINKKYINPVMDYIKNNPGTTLDEISDNIDFSESYLTKVITHLRRDNSILCKYDQRNLLYFASIGDFYDYRTLSEKLALNAFDWVSAREINVEQYKLSKLRALIHTAVKHNILEKKREGSNTYFRYTGKRIKPLKLPDASKNNTRKLKEALITLSVLLLHNTNVDIKKNRNNLFFTNFNKAFYKKLAIAWDTKPVSFWLKNKEINEFIKLINNCKDTVLLKPLSKQISKIDNINKALLLSDSINKIIQDN